jgi:hypothetical protein
LLRHAASLTYGAADPLASGIWKMLDRMCT